MKNFLKYFHLQSTVESELFTGGVWSPTFFGNTKFEVKNISEFSNLQRAVDSEFFTGGVWVLTFCSHAKFEHS